MPRKERPFLSLLDNQFRESYRFTLNKFIRGDKTIEAQYDQSTLKMVKSLGSGASGYVSLYYDTNTKKDVAVKSISVIAKSNRDQIFHEEDCFSNATEGQYVVQKLGYFISDGYLHIVLEYMNEGSMDRHYNKDNPIPDKVLRCISWQLLNALCELRKANIIHRVDDLKPQNILLNDDGCVKFADFGISKVISDTQKSSTFVGTLRYMSPERINNGNYTYRCDFWSTAVVILEAALGYYPFTSESTHLDLEKAITGNKAVSILENVNPELASFLKDWLSEESSRQLPMIKLRDPYLHIDGKPITRDISKRIIAEWLKEQHTHLSTPSVKFKTFELLQEKRRKEMMNTSLQRTSEFIKKKRHSILFEMDNQPQNSNSPFPINFNTAYEDRRKTEANKDWIKRVNFSKSVCIPEWMIEIPPDLKENWICIPRPDGKRFILSSKKGKTVLYNINGYSQLVKSNLPGGALNYHGNCVFDIIQGNDAFYVMDLLSFNNTDFEDSEAESRLFTLCSRIKEDDYYILIRGQKKPVLPITYYPCSFESLLSIYQNVTNECNGFLFMNRYSCITEGSTPMQLLWKDDHTAQYFINTDSNGVIQTQQEVTLLYKDHSLWSLESFCVCDLFIADMKNDSLVRCCVGGVFFDHQSNQWRIQDLHVIGQASYYKTLPDTISKIVFQQMARDCPLSFERILQTLKT